MRCQVLLTLITLSYLICVLLWSGLQKEDLDVNMLRKLQRHNVNIDDMNNEDIRQQCASTPRTDIHDQSITKKTNYSENGPTIEASTENQKKTNSMELDLTTVIKYFIKSRKSPHLIVEVESGSSPNTQTDANGRIFNSSYTYRNEPVTEVSYTKSESNEIINIDKIMDVINAFTRTSIRDKDIKPDVTNNPQDTEKSTNINIIKNNNNMQIIEMDYISKIIAEYVNAQSTTFTSTFPPTTATIKLNIDTISRHIERFLRNNPISEKASLNNTLILNKNNIETGPNLKKYNVNNTSNNISLQSINISRNNVNPKYIDQSNNLNNANSERIRVKNNALKYISDILQTDQLRNDVPFKNYASSVTEVPFINDTREETKHTIQDTNNLYTKLEKDNSMNKEVWRNLPPDTIREIAESVKAIVLKDLQIFNTTIQVSTSTTEAAKFHKQDQGNLQEATHVIEKFMELFQQFKSIKESTIISGDTKFKMTEQKHVKQQYKSPIKFMYPPIMTAVNPYGTRNKVEPFPPIYINQFNQDLQVNTPITHNLQIEKQSAVNKFKMFSHKVETPITLQTNADEIPPLGIPISKPMKLMNQNIIVTTKHPFMKPTNHRQYPDFMQRVGNNYNKHNNERNELPKTYDFSNSARESRGFSRHDYRDHEVKAFSNTDRERPKYQDNYRDRTPYMSHYTPHYDRSDYERMRLRNQQVKRFHERLERVDDRTMNSREDKPSNDGEDNYKYKVASRQQLPLADAKSSRYDDTHFRNFLKTQQKVNDMLERILATKTKPEQPSVEIP